jgi:hypothetical protein
MKLPTGRNEGEEELAIGTGLFDTHKLYLKRLLAS